MKITTSEALPRCWTAVDSDNYGGPGDPIGSSTVSADDAVTQLVERLLDDERATGYDAAQQEFADAATSAARCMRMAATLLRDAVRPQASMALLAAAVDLEKAVGIEPQPAPDAIIVPGPSISEQRRMGAES
jgi:uncharacterized phage protein gp47/JayE